MPALGWFEGNWSVATVLVLYWLETCIGTIFVAVRIMLHRRIQPSKGHWNYQAPERPAPSRDTQATYLTAFLVPAIAFTFVHGIFLAVLGAMMISKGLSSEVNVDRHNVLTGLVAILVFQLLEFVSDLTVLRSRPFAWIEKLGQVTFGRVIVIHLTIIGGMAAVMFTGANRHFFGVFVFLKAMFQCSLALPQYHPRTPPAWLSHVMDRIGSPAHDHTNFAQFWKQTDDEEAARIARNEEPMSIPGRNDD